VIDFGTAYKPTPHQQLDFHCGFGFSAATPDHSIGFGYSVRFQVIRSKMTVKKARPACRNCTGRSGLQIPGDVDDDDALIPTYKKKQLQQLSTLVMERSLPLMFNDELGNEDGDLTIGMVALDLQDVLDERCYDEAVG
jgi:hypothetical protein